MASEVSRSTSGADPDPYAGLAQIACRLLDASRAVVVQREAQGWMIVGAYGPSVSGDEIETILAGGRTGRSDERWRMTRWEATARRPGGALLVAAPDSTSSAGVMASLAGQAAALAELRLARAERAAFNRRRDFGRRLERRLREASDPGSLVALAVKQTRAELEAECVSFGSVCGDEVRMEAIDELGGQGATRSLPLAAFGMPTRMLELREPICFPTMGSAAVALGEGRTVSGLIHAKAPGARAWSDPELALLAEAAEVIWAQHRRATCEAELRSGEGRLRALLESVSDGFYALDGNWRFTVFNRAAERFFGCSREAVAGRSLRDVFPEVARSPLEDHLARVMATGIPGSMEMRSAARPDREVEIRASAQLGGGVAVAFSDVTERNIGVHALAEAEARLTALVRQARAGIAETDLEGRFVAVNDRFCELVGRSESELLNLDQASITHSDDVPASLSRCREMVETGAAFGIEKRYIQPSGTAVRVANAVGLLEAAGRRSALAVVVGLDGRR